MTVVVVIFRIKQVRVHGTNYTTRFDSKVDFRKVCQNISHYRSTTVLFRITYSVQLDNLNKKTTIKIQNVEMHLLQVLLIIFIPLNTAAALSN